MNLAGLRAWGALLLVLLPWRAVAQIPHHSFGLDVFVTSSGGAGDAKTDAGWNPGGKPLGGGWVTAEVRNYTQHRERDSSLGLEVQIRNVAYTSDTGRLEWFFFSKPLKGGDEHLYDRGSEEITLGPSSSAKYSIRSKVLHNSITKKLTTTNGVGALGQPIPPSASVQKSGSKVSGWIVRLMVDNEPFLLKASSPSLLAISKSVEAAEPGQGKKGK